ncbi:FAD-dependent oxidoreductase [Paeniglutamicibacter sp. ABSL32-1]|uniref:FAD-dependent oxidoreductase n=1 Tax=Paeniglutamicibacter quisquiliarum TaxID=2849498 RepID=UPI001C2D71F8|nr:FAD-dependent oxidoreductase [Paeniglutamicibacter quisquiliarum]MBV1777777.1 FAD-dependent oxidoreductase [Paeniglutamicibacter quisquiliarum]
MNTPIPSPATPITELESAYDVVVIGSGAAGLTTAVRAAHQGARVLVLEKAALLGGTSSAGGGVIWAPNNHLAKEAGFADSKSAGAAYLNAAAGHAMEEVDIKWFIDTAAQAIEFLDTETRVNLVPLARPDYHMEWAGAAHGGRSLDNLPFSGEGHPGLSAMLRPPTYFPLLSMIERDNLNGRAPDAGLLAERAASGVRTMGGALVGSLAASALDLGVVLAVEAPVTDLVRSETGWALEIAGSSEVRADAVVIASGGFEWNERLRRAFLPLPVTPIGAPSNEGDGLELGLAVGASVRDMTAVWGVPVITPPAQQYDSKPSGRMGNVEMTLPGSITVNASGRRFVNEALNYHDAARVFANIDPITSGQANNPAWLVFDANYLEKYPVAGSTPGVPEEWMASAGSLAELGSALGIDAAALAETVRTFNLDAEKGVDSEFGRGASEQDRHLGDASNLPNPCLAPLVRAPFYAVPLHAGVLGTSGGLATNHDGQVLDRHGKPIEGLYAAGNVAASVFRNNYPGGGATLGSAVTRAFAAGRHIAAEGARKRAAAGVVPA